MYFNSAQPFTCSLVHLTFSPTCSIIHVLIHLHWYSLIYISAQFLNCVFIHLLTQLHTMFMQVFTQVLAFLFISLLISVMCNVKYNH